MSKTANFLLVAAGLAVGTASPVRAQSYAGSDWRQGALYNVVLPGAASDPYASEPARAGGGSFGYNATVNYDY